MKVLDSNEIELDWNKKAIFLDDNEVMLEETDSIRWGDGQYFLVTKEMVVKILSHFEGMAQNK